MTKRYGLLYLDGKGFSKEQAIKLWDLHKEYKKGKYSKWGMNT